MNERDIDNATPEELHALSIEAYDNGAYESARHLAKLSEFKKRKNDEDPNFI